MHAGCREKDFDSFCSAPPASVAASERQQAPASDSQWSLRSFGCLLVLCLVAIAAGCQRLRQAAQAKLAVPIVVEGRLVVADGSDQQLATEKDGLLSALE